MGRLQTAHFIIHIGVCPVLNTHLGLCVNVICNYGRVGISASRNQDYTVAVINAAPHDSSINSLCD